LSLFVPDAVVVIVGIAGGGAGLSAGTKPWWKTSWSSSASSRHRRLGGKGRWQPDKALPRATHPVMQVVRPPAAAGQSRRPSSSPGSASVEDLDDDDDAVNNGGVSLWQHGRRDPVVVVAVIDDDNDKDDDCIVEAEQRGRTAIGSAATTAAVFLDLVLVGVILSGISVVVGIIGIVASSRRCVVASLRRHCRRCRWSSQPCCRHCPCLRHCGSHCCCRQHRRCSPPLMVGCCVAYSFICHLICHPPLSSSFDRQHFCRWPPSQIANLRQPLSYPSPSLLLSMVGLF
jgi:hypothetical protein